MGKVGKTKIQTGNIKGPEPKNVFLIINTLKKNPQKIEFK